MYICLLPQNGLFCQQVAIITIELDHIAIHIPNLVLIERCLGWEAGPQTSEMSTFLYKSIVHRCIFVCPPKQTHVLESRFNYNRGRQCSNIHTKFD